MPRSELYRVMTLGKARPGQRKGRRRTDSQEENEEGEGEDDEGDLANYRPPANLDFEDFVATRGGRARGHLTPRMRKEIGEQMQESMNPATIKKYGTNTWHYIMWCEHNGFYPIPHESRIIAYLQHRLTHGVPGTACAPITSVEALKGIKAGLAKAQTVVSQRWETDCGNSIYSNASVTMISTHVATTEARRNAETIRDPQRNTAADTLCTEELHQCEAFLDRKGVREQPIKFNSLMKTCRAALYRGDDARRLSWSDLFLTTLPITSVGPDPCTALCMLSKGGKTNQYGRTEYGILFRGKQPQHCAQSAIALWFWAIFHLLNEPPPDLTTDEWIKYKVWPAGIGASAQAEDKSKEMQTTSQSRVIGEVFKEVGVKTEKVLHAFRPSGAMAAVQDGNTLDEVALAGRWKWGKNDVLAFCYVGLICKSVGLSLAGHSREKGQHVIGRSGVSEEWKGRNLGKGIFPWLEEEEKKVQEFNEDHPECKLLAAMSFIAVLKYFRRILIQDVLTRPDDIFLRAVLGSVGEEAKEVAMGVVREREARHLTEGPVTSKQLNDLLSTVKLSLESKLDLILTTFIRGEMSHFPMEELERRARVEEAQEVTPTLERVMRASRARAAAGAKEGAGDGAGAGRGEGAGAGGGGGEEDRPPPVAQRELFPPTSTRAADPHPSTTARANSHSHTTAGTSPHPPTAIGASPHTPRRVRRRTAPTPHSQPQTSVPQPQAAPVPPQIPTNASALEELKEQWAEAKWPRFEDQFRVTDYKSVRRKL